jgi:hypothetical protein
MRSMIFVAAASLAVLFAAGAPALGAGVAGAASGTADWRCCWHDNCWWYWTPQQTWLRWTGTAWVPYQQPAGPGTPYATYYGSYETPASAAVPAPVVESARARYSFPSDHSYGAATRGAGPGLSGYGWAWGPGTSFSNGPGPRF